ncbi:MULTISPECIES: DUF1934 family protein [Erysipelothrix]|uniref:DUF1934 family protein n=1 Tax=Erysipelothrix TaxID=1647 RepID=UPI001378B43D|nr:DUF1934 domain-containing protein [Erysipelothrix sp. strain 2 (EsS2-6-Brazil)]NBA01188.1 DUF1934 family protein [Erysipelothrix rhusiopathiae]
MKYVRGISIKTKVTITQKSRDESFHHTDTQADLINYGPYQRIMYDEEDAYVILDFTNDEVSFKRQGEWLTQGVFCKGEQTELLVSSAQGIIVFEVEVETLEIRSGLLYMRYHLKQAGSHVDTLEFECRWEPEV